MYLDYKKTFDSVPHKRLVTKLEGYGIKGSLLLWLKKFLKQRQQRVVINGNLSKWTDVLSGIPQGSILGLIMLIQYINDLPGVVGSICKLFADDCKLYGNIASEADQKLQEDIERLCKWSKDWLLGYNIKKCKVVSFGNVQFEYEYGMTDTQNNLHVLSTEDSESDLSILYTEGKKFSNYL